MPAAATTNITRRNINTDPAGITDNAGIGYSLDLTTTCHLHENILLT
jgi:hypothetical protein